jgi:hypothetical protein
MGASPKAREGHLAQPEDGVVRHLEDAEDDPMERIPMWVACSTYFGYAYLFLLGFIRDFLGRKLLSRLFSVKDDERDTRPGYAPLLADFEDFYQRRLYRRVHDVFDRPICSAPGPYIDVMLRDFQLLAAERPLNGKVQRCLNLGSYNYLGFAQDGGADDFVYDTLQKYSVSTCSPRSEMGTAPVHVELERQVADFVGKPAAIVVGMGFATNSTLIPCLVGRGGLIISDSLNHSSIVSGARTSRAKIKTFKHNDIESLEEVLKAAIAEVCPPPPPPPHTLTHIPARTGRVVAGVHLRLRVEGLTWQCGGRAGAAWVHGVQAVEEDRHPGRGPLLDGGLDLPPTRHRRAEKEVQGVPLGGRGALDRGPGLERPGRRGVLGLRPGRHRHPDGHVHQVLRRRRRYGTRSDPSLDRAARSTDDPARPPRVVARVGRCARPGGRG